MKAFVTLDDGTVVLETTGDVNALAHGGGVVYKVPPRGECFWQFWSAREGGQKNYDVYTAYVPDDVLGHYEPDFKELMEVTQESPRELRRLSSSKNAKDRAYLVSLIVGCVGPTTICKDNYEELSPFDMAGRWGCLFGEPVNDVPMVDAEDYMIRERATGQWECGTIDGVYLGRHPNFETCLSHVAHHMQKIQNQDANVFLEHSLSQVERVSWSFTDYLGKMKVSHRKNHATGFWKNAVRPYMEAAQKAARKSEKAASRNDAILKDRKRFAQKQRQKGRLEKAREVREKIERMYHEDP